MWDNLTRTDLEHVRDELKRRRAEMLTRQAAELSGLDAERVGVETLERLVDAFAQKFKKATMPAPEATITTQREAREAAPLSHHRSQKPPPVTRNPPKRDYGQSNFETFSRALSRSIRTLVPDEPST